MTSQIPEWRKAWKLDDPAWVKQRRTEWKRIKERLPVVAWFVHKTDYSMLKNYFMTGSGFNPEPTGEKRELFRYSPDDPLCGIEAPVIFECWLNPNRSSESWQLIADRYLPSNDQRSMHGTSRDASLFDTSRARFRELIRDHFPGEGNLFDGLEERMYRLFAPTRCRPEDFPGLTNKQYLNECRSVFATTGKPLWDYLGAGTPNRESIAPVLAREWCDSLPGAYERFRQLCEESKEKRCLQNYLHKGIGADLALAKAIVTRQEKYDPRQVSVAVDILRWLSEMEFPDFVQEVVAPYLEPSFIENLPDRRDEPDAISKSRLST